MANLPNLNQIVNDTAANAVPVNENFTTIKTHLDTEMINRDGSVAMTQPLLLSAIAPTDENHAVRLRDIGAQGELGIPTGTMFDYADDGQAALVDDVAVEGVKKPIAIAVDQ